MKCLKTKIFLEENVTNLHETSGGLTAPSYSFYEVTVSISTASSNKVSPASEDGKEKNNDNLTLLMTLKHDCECAYQRDIALAKSAPAEKYIS